MAGGSASDETIVLREATRNDAAGIAECWYRAFSPYPLNDWLLPPDANHVSYLMHFARTTRSSILKRDTRVMVAASTKDGRVAGYISYKEFKTQSAPTARRSMAETVSYRLDVLVTSVVEYVRWIVYGEDHRAIDDRFNLIAQAQQNVLRQEGYPGVEHYLYITWLAVHPDFQGRGVCSLMLQYGVKRGLPMYLEASDEGYPVYLHKGFQELSQRLEIRREDGSLVESVPTMLHPGKSV